MSFSMLEAAGGAALQNWRLIGGGEGIRWTELDEDLSVAALLRVA